MSHNFDFPQNVMRYSKLRYLQNRVTQCVRALPESFAELSDWESYRTQLLGFLRERLPVWELGGERFGRVVTSAPLGSDLVLESVDVHFEDGFFVPVQVYRLADASAPSGAVLVCPGYGQRKNDAGVADIGMALARSGLVAVTVEYGGTGECADRPDLDTNVNNICAAGELVGITNVGLRVMTNIAVLEYLKTRREVDAQRIGITGLCQGSMSAFVSAAVCEELRAVAPLCGATNYEAIINEYCNRQGGWSGISMYVFDMLKVADLQHVFALIAPRPLLVQNDIIDLHWPASGFEKVKNLAANVYDLYGAGDKCAFKYEHGPHLFAEPYITNIVAWMSEHLREHAS